MGDHSVRKHKFAWVPQGWISNSYWLGWVSGLNASLDAWNDFVPHASLSWQTLAAIRPFKVRKSWVLQLRFTYRAIHDARCTTRGEGHLHSTSQLSSRLCFYFPFSVFLSALVGFGLSRHGLPCREEGVEGSGPISLYPIPLHGIRYCTEASPRVNTNWAIRCFPHDSEMTRQSLRLYPFTYFTKWEISLS